MASWPEHVLPSEVSPVTLIESFKEMAYDSGYIYTEAMYARSLRRWQLEYIYLTAEEKHRFIRFINAVRVSSTIFDWTHPHAFTVINATNASPIVVTTLATHNLYNEDQVVIEGVTGNTAANGTYEIDNVTATTFELVDTTGNGSYVNGGTAALFLPRVRIVQSADTWEGFGKRLGPDQNNDGLYSLVVELEECYDIPFLTI